MSSTLDALNLASKGDTTGLDWSKDDAAQRTSLPPLPGEIPSLVRELFDRAREARRPQLAQWKRNYAGLNNRDYKPGANPSDEKSAVSAIWPPVASSVAWKTDQRPILEVTPVMPPFSPYAEFYQRMAVDMNTCIKSTFINHALEAEVSKVLWDVETYGIGYYKNSWEPHLADGLGDAAFRRVDPFTIYPDPFARNTDQLTYIIEARVMTVADAERAWPGSAKKLLSTPDTRDIDMAPHKLDSNLNEKAPRFAISGLTPGSPNPATTSQGNRNPRDMPVVTVLECYVRGTLIDKKKPVKSPDEAASGHDPEIEVANVQDDWRCIIVSGEHVLMDEPCSKVHAFGKHPYTRQVLMDTGEWYGPCIVEMLLPIQRKLNWFLDSIESNVYLMGNPVLLEDPRSVSRNRKFTNRPGQRIEAFQGQASWMPPPTMHDQIPSSMISYYKGEIETITGLSAMVRGFAPTGRNAQGVLDSVQDAAFVRVRASLRELEFALREVSSKLVATIAMFYDEPRMMSMTGEDGRDTHLALQHRHFYVTDYEDRGKRIPLRFTLTADAGSQLLTSKTARASMAVDLFKNGAIDVYELLMAMEWPNFANVAQRVMEQQAAVATEKSKK